MKKFDFLIVGGGIFGITAAIELIKRKYTVGLINPGKIPHPEAASTDISKIVRMEYGSDKLYFKMAETCIGRWHEWNDVLGEKLYHEVGFLMLCKETLNSGNQSYEQASYHNLLEAGYSPETLNSDDLKDRFPGINPTSYQEAVYNPRAGYVESARVIEKLTVYAQSLGVIIHQGQTAEQVMVVNGRVEGLKTKEGEQYACGHLIVAAGANTPGLLPELQAYIEPTGHPVFWVKPQDPSLFSHPRLTVFTADISNSGWYGFPFADRHGVIKLGKHTNGLRITSPHTVTDITDVEIADLRTFLQESFPALADAALVYTRRCLYTDTLDGHFWIDNHPEIEGLTVSTGGSGHGMKMGPLVGEIAADAAEGITNQYAERFKWRHLTKETIQAEEARFIAKNKD